MALNVTTMKQRTKNNKPSPKRLEVIKIIRKNNRILAYKKNGRQLVCHRDYEDTELLGLCLVEVISNTKFTDFYKPIKALERGDVYVPTSVSKYQKIEKELADHGHDVRVVFVFIPQQDGTSKKFPQIAIVDKSKEIKPFQVRLKDNDPRFPNGIPLVKEEIHYFAVKSAGWKNGLVQELSTCEHFIMIDDKVYGYNLIPGIDESNRILNKTDIPTLDFDALDVCFIGSKRSNPTEVKKAIEKSLGIKAA